MGEQNPTFYVGTSIQEESTPPYNTSENDVNDYLESPCHSTTGDPSVDSDIEPIIKTNGNDLTQISSKRAHFVVIFSVALLTYSLVLYSLVLTQYVYSRVKDELFPNSSLQENSSLSVCDVNKTSESYQNRQQVQTETSKWTVYNGLAEKIPGFLINSVIGSLSDRYGRKPMLIFTFVGEFFKISIYAILIYFNSNVYYFLLATATEGISGGMLGALSVSFAYIADITATTKQRVLSIIYVEAALSIGGSISGFTSGYFIDSIGYMYSMLIPAAIVGIVVVFISLFMEESRSRTSRLRVPLLDNLTNAFKFFIKDTSATSKRWKYIVSMLIFMSVSFGSLSSSSIDTLYQLNAPFCWSSLKIGWYSSIRIFSAYTIGAIVLKLVKEFTNISIEFLAVLSSISSAGGNIMKALAKNDLTLFLVPVVSIIGGLTIPIMRGYMSRMTPPDKQGALFASIACAETFCMLVSDVSSKYIYIATLAVYRGMVYFVFAGYSLISVILLTILITGSRESPVKLQKPGETT